MADWLVEMQALRRSLKPEYAADAAVFGVAVMLTLAIRYLEHPDVQALGFAVPADTIAERAQAALAGISRQRILTDA